jgi:DNA-binding transcriptional MerR regulator
MAMTIKEVAELMDISTDTLRYYERIGVIHAVPRNKYGVRNYHTIHIQWIQAVLKLKASGMTLEKIIEYARLAHLGEKTIETRKNLLEEEKNRMLTELDTLKECLSIIDFKLDNYYNEVVPTTKKIIDKIGSNPED